MVQLRGSEGEPRKTGSDPQFSGLGLSVAEGFKDRVWEGRDRGEGPPPPGRFPGVGRFVGQ